MRHQRRLARAGDGGVRSGKTCSTASTRWKSTSRPCANAVRTSNCWPTISCGRTHGNTKRTSGKSHATQGQAATVCLAGQRARTATCHRTRRRALQRRYPPCRRLPVARPGTARGRWRDTQLGSVGTQRRGESRPPVRRQHEPRRPDVGHHALLALSQTRKIRLMKIPPFLADSRLRCRPVPDGLRCLFLRCGATVAHRCRVRRGLRWPVCFPSTTGRHAKSGRCALSYGASATAG